MTVTVKKLNANGKASVTVFKKKETDTVASQALEMEDDFTGMYFNAKTGEGNVIKPRYDLARLEKFVTTNNALLSCILAMEVNIDGTGYAVTTKDEDTTPTSKEKLQIESVEDFFNDPYPQTSFTTMRRKLRWDLESTGNGYFEVIRNAVGLLIYLKRVDPKTMRLIRLGEAKITKKEVIRNGKKFIINMNVRPRAYVQKVGTNTIYFKEFGTGFNINSQTGEWSDDNTAISFNDRGNEIIHFTTIDDSHTPYGLPRWINQIPSIVGSREAEEYNLEFFNNGGIPPVMISVSGGVIAQQSKTELDNLLSGKAKTKMRGVVIETHSVGGDLSSNNKVDVKIDKFGNEQVKDSMFEKYDVNCEKRIRSSFRLPPLFVGKAEDYSYATAYASYAIGEAQVFKPERFEFDEIINKTIMKELDADLVLKSKPLTIDNVEVQLKSVEIAANNKVISGEGLVSNLNTMSNMSLEFEEDSQLNLTTPPNTAGVDIVPSQSIKSEHTHSHSNNPLHILANDWIIAKGLNGGTGSVSKAKELGLLIKKLDEKDKLELNQIVATSILSNLSADPAGGIDLCACASDVIEG